MLWRLRDEVDVFILNRLGDGVGGGVKRDVELLAPEPGLLRVDLVVQAVGLVIELEALLAELQQRYGDRDGTEEAEDQFEHGEISICDRKFEISDRNL
jgi:hypothetical protein